MWQAPPCKARVKLKAPAEAIASRLPTCAGLIEAIDDATCWFEAAASTWEYLAMNLVWSGVDFEVTDPPELLAEVQTLASRYTRAAIAPGPESPAVPAASAHPRSSTES